MPTAISVAATTCAGCDQPLRQVAQRHGEFSAHKQVCVGAEDAEGRTTLAGYMLRAPMSLQKMTYDAASGTVVYRSNSARGFLLGRRERA